MKGDCGQKALALAKNMSLETNSLLGYQELASSLPTRPSYPLGASCALCEKEETADGKRLKCSGCKFTHYW